MHKLNKTRGSFDPVLSLLAGLFICYLRRATKLNLRTQGLSWSARFPHWLFTKYTSSQTQRTEEERFKEKLLAEKEHKRMT